MAQVSGYLFFQKNVKMPRPRYQTRTEQKKEVIDATLASLAEFTNLSYWSKSSRGNLTPWEGLRVTIFNRKDSYNWCYVEDGFGPTFSSETVLDEEEAIHDLGCTLIF